MAKVKKDKAPLPFAKWFGGKLMPLTAYDAEALDAYPMGSEFSLTPTSKRSLPHHRTYWRALDAAVKATDRWPNAEKLHIALKVQLGYVTPIYNLKGDVIGMIPDSIGFDEMTQQEFRQFFDKAITALSDALGYDALAWMEQQP